MPSLTPDQRDLLLGPKGPPCRRCGVVPWRNYCRSCDAFFDECACGADFVHQTHRTYRWNGTRIVAIPNFDNPHEHRKDSTR